MAFTLITITATSIRPDGQPAQGRVTATLSEQIQNGTETVDATPVVGIFNAAGQLCDDSGLLPLQLVANNDPATTPGDSTYDWVIELDNAPVRTGTASVPYTASGATIDLSVLLPSP